MLNLIRIPTFLFFLIFSLFNFASANTENFKNCLSGYSYSCDLSLLSKEELHEVSTQLRAKNFRDCLSGYSSLCKPQYLTETQKRLFMMRKLKGILITVVMVTQASVIEAY